MYYFLPHKIEQNFPSYQERRGSLESPFLPGFLLLGATRKPLSLPVSGDGRLEQTSHASGVRTWYPLFSQQKGIWDFRPQSLSGSHSPLEVGQLAAWQVNNPNLP